MKSTNRETILNKIETILETNGLERPESGLLEACNITIKERYNNVQTLLKEKGLFSYQYDGDDSWVNKNIFEQMHYKKLEGGLLHSMNESKYYLKEDWMKSRRFVVTSTDCISVIQLMFRPEGIHLGVYFRSSHFDNLLPVDLRFLYSLVETSLDYLVQRAGSETYEEVTKEVIEDLKLKPIDVSLSFGSLHRKL